MCVAHVRPRLPFLLLFIHINKRQLLHENAPARTFVRTSTGPYSPFAPGVLHAAIFIQKAHTHTHTHTTQSPSQPYKGFRRHNAHERESVSHSHHHTYTRTATSSFLLPTHTHTTAYDEFFLSHSLSLSLSLRTCSGLMRANWSLAIFNRDGSIAATPFQETRAIAYAEVPNKKGVRYSAGGMAEPSRRRRRELGRRGVCERGREGGGGCGRDEEIDGVLLLVLL